MPNPLKNFLEKKLPHKVLVVSNKPPYPIIDGGCFALNKFSELLEECFTETYYFALSTPKHPFILNELPRKWTLNKNFFTSFVNTRVQLKDIVKFLSGSSIRVSRFYQLSTEQDLLELINKKDIDTVVFESIYSAVYLPAIKKIPGIQVIIRAHNIEHHIWQRYNTDQPAGFKKWLIHNETGKLEKFEMEILNASDANIFISDLDLNYYKVTFDKINGVSIPVQMEPQALSKQTSPGKLKLFHLGAMDWLPNQLGIEKFITKDFPSILRQYPETELHLAGKSMPDEFYKYQSANIFIHGQVDNADAFIRQYDALIVPIESGSGIRIKILEAMAAGKPVISTSQGIEGIPAQSGVEFLLVENSNEWIQAIDLLLDPNKFDSIVHAAQNFIEANYSKEVLRDRLYTFILNNIKY
jgi:polysaccharide biosynthesis protein PslH